MALQQSRANKQRVKADSMTPASLSQGCVIPFYPWLPPGSSGCWLGPVRAKPMPSPLKIVGVGLVERQTEQMEGLKNRAPREMR